MNLEALSAIAQIVAAIGVIASLFYLAAQIRQNTKSQRSVVVDSLTSSLNALLGPQSTDPALLRSFAAAVENWESCTEEDRVRAVAMLFAVFKLFENAWFQERQGSFDAQQWEGWDAYIRVYYHRPGVKSWWAMRRATFARGFRDYLENTKPLPGVPSPTEMIRGKP